MARTYGTGKNSIQYRGDTYKYNKVGDLAKTMNVTVSTARRFINDDGRRLVIVPSELGVNDVEVINIRENFTGLLKDFGVTRKNLAREKMIRPSRVGTELQNERTLVRKIPRNEPIRVFLRVTVVGFFDSTIGDEANRIIDETYKTKRPLTRDRDGTFNREMAEAYSVVGRNGTVFPFDTRVLTRQVAISPNEINDFVYDYGGTTPYYMWWTNSSPDEYRELIGTGRGTGIIPDYFKKIPGYIYDYSIQVFTHRWNQDNYERGDNTDVDVLAENELVFDGQELRAPSSYLLEDWAKIQYSLTEGPDSCVVNYVSKVLPGLRSDIKKLAEDPITLRDFEDFLEENKVDYNVYNVLGELTGQTSFENPNGRLNMIVYNNHVYPIAGSRPTESRPRVQKVKVVRDILGRLTRLLEAGVVPKKINVANSTSVKTVTDVPVRSFVHKNTKYICNPEYRKCEAILASFNIDTNKYMSDDITIGDIPSIYMKHHNMANPLSFLPNSQAYKSPACLWKTSRRIRTKDVVTIDKNKCYSYILENISYAYVFDYRCDTIIDLKVDGEGVDLDTYSLGKMYMASPAKWSILMPCTKLYTGEYLAKCKARGFKFTVTEELHAHQVFNPYRGTVKAMRKAIDDGLLTWDEFKITINILIGKMEMACRRKCTKRFSGVFDNEAAEYQASFKTRISPEYQLGFETETSWSNARNRFPLSLQIKDEARMLIYDKIVELGLADEDIVQINTDSISYYGTLPDGLDSNDFNGWKSSKFTELSVNPCVMDTPVTVLPSIDQPSTLPSLIPRILHIKYAGAGKTYDIIENLVPRIEAEGKSYIVLTPTHKTLEEYVRKGVNATVIQTFVYSGDIPEEDYVIVDEIGFVGAECHDVLYKIALAGKHLECYGDFNQLPPPDSNGITYGQRHYLEYLFTNIDTEFVNMRNGFTTDYYDKLINSRDINWLTRQVNKYSTRSYVEAEKIVCYCHTTRKLYNDRMMEYLGFESIYEIGCRIMVTNNSLLEEYGICNRMEFEIVKLHATDDGKVPADTNITVRNMQTGITYKVLMRDFVRGGIEPAYAINVHQLQGSTIDSYYWASRDNMYLTARAAYVIISRLRS